MSLAPDPVNLGESRAVRQLTAVVRELSSIVAELAGLVTILMIRDVEGSPISQASPEDLLQMGKHASSLVERARTFGGETPATPPPTIARGKS